MSNSTIKIKNSNSAGNTPSSLSQGELAINVADGNLFYGDGSSVKQNFALSELTSSGNVDINGTLSLGQFSDVSASLAAAVAGGDNLGNHTATQDLNMGGNAITSVGNVDGRDLSTDGTKLDGIEANADVTDTSNVTAAGALMDSELTEIATVKALTAAGISGSFNAASASFSTRVTANDAKLTANTSNVTSAGALMDSEVTNLAQVKAFDSSDYATAAQGALADSAQQPPSEGAFANGDKTKLDGIEASADVTDTANVTSAGALMDSELSEIATVKALTAAGISGSFNSVSASLAADIPTNNNQLTNGAGYITDYTVTSGDVTAHVGDIDHDSLLNFVANEHIDHSTITIGSGKGLSGGGTINTNRSLSLNTGSTHFTDGASEAVNSASFSTRVTTLEDAGYTTNTGTVTEVTVGTGLDVTNGTTTPNVTLDLTEVIASDAANRVLTSDGDGTLTAESELTYNGTTLNVDGYIDVDSSATSQAVVDITNTNTTSPMSSDNYALKVAGGVAIGTPGGQTKAYGGYFTAGDTNLTNPDSVALYAQSHQDGAPNSYAALFSGSAGGVVGINTLEPTVELDVVGDISASNNIVANAFYGDGSNLTNLPSQTDENFTTADHSKLDGIEANADVTDATNVQAAGAVMDSEVTDLDGIKSLTVPNSTTISTFGASLVDDANAAAARTTLGVDASGTDNSTDVTLAGSLDYITISGQEITRNAIDLSTDVTGQIATSSITNFPTEVSRSAAAAGFGAGGGGGSGTVTEVTVGTGLDVTNGTTTPNVTLDLSEVGFTGTANGLITSDNDGTVTTESTLTYSGTILNLDGTQTFTPGTAGNGIATRVDNQWESTSLVNNGEYIQVGTGISVTQHELYNLGTSGWVSADADAVSTSAGLLGVAPATATNNLFLIKGVFNTLSTNVTDGGIGKVVYVSTTAGDYTCTAPSAAGDVVRIVGYIVDSFVTGRTTYYKIYFNPSSDWIEL